MTPDPTLTDEELAEMELLLTAYRGTVGSFYLVHVPRLIAALRASQNRDAANIEELHRWANIAADLRVERDESAAALRTSRAESKEGWALAAGIGAARDRLAEEVRRWESLVPLVTTIDELRAEVERLVAECSRLRVVRANVERRNQLCGEQPGVL